MNALPSAVLEQDELVPSWMCQVSRQPETACVQSDTGSFTSKLSLEMTLCRSNNTKIIDTKCKVLKKHLGTNLLFNST